MRYELQWRFLFFWNTVMGSAAYNSDKDFLIRMAEGMQRDRADIRRMKLRVFDADTRTVVWRSP
jgi:hypothetical protein